MTSVTRRWDEAAAGLCGLWDGGVSALERALDPFERWCRRVGREGMSVAARLVVVEILAAGALIAVLAPDSTAGRSAAAVGAVVALGFVALRDRREAVLWLFAWLLLLGATRRLLSMVQVDPTRDPLLVVAPLVSAVLFVRAAATGALRRLTPLGGGVAVCMAVILLGGLNPRQPSLGSAVAGVAIWTVPLLFFWIGRSAGDELLRWLGLLVLVIGAALAIYGLGQILIGLPPWDQEWLDARGSGSDREYSSLFIGPDTVRPFGASSSAAGFAIAMGVVTTVGSAVAVRQFRRLDTRAAALWALVAGVAGIALILNAVRTVLLFTVAALFLVLVIGFRRSLVRSFVVLAAIGLALSLTLSQVDPESLDRDGVEGSLRRIVALVGDPLGDDYENTAGAHVDQFADGVEVAFRQPLGVGPGSVGLAGERLGDESISTETDISNAGVAFGLVGLAVFAITLAVGLWTAFRAVRVRPRGPTDPGPLLALGVLAVAVVCLRAWFNGEHWAMAPLLWTCLGWSDRRTVRSGHDVPVAITGSATADPA